ncbi:hypothetical protein BDZ94DRAFT_145692 [Collybia nuda]|uniref:Uncharacterized protein n=1 Tax=Collybia nuda TaxID=64659 RepID=A0A9P5XYU6_9AGAR|nr:hypothetical protein BDZ94DRAFT_145692 [Collybia nuda]
MCTISHCHKILPSFYRYKRCEQHRLQNRHHSKLKRVREKVLKTTGPNGEDVEIMNDDGEENEKSEKENKTGKRWDKNAKDEIAARDVELEYDTKDEDKPRKRNFICVSYGCHNLLGPAVRWRHCEICRARERIRKREKKELESEGKMEEGEKNAQKEVERLKEMMRRMAAGEKVNEGILDPEARASGSGPGQRDKGRGESADMLVEPDLASNTAHQTDVSKEVTPTTVTAIDTPSTSPSIPSTNSANTPNSFIHPPAYKESPETFRSVFRATPVPFMFTPISNANVLTNRIVASSDSAVPEVVGIQPTTSSLNTFGDANSSNTSRTGGKPLTFASTDTPLTFRAYKPKTATSAVGRLLAQNPELSVQVFKDLLLPGKEKQVNTGLVGGSSYHVYKSTPPPAREAAVFVPTIPTTPPFVYQPTQKKQRTYATNGSTEATQNAEARPEQESNSNMNDSRAYVETSSANSSIVTNAVASGSGPANPTPQPSTTPAPVLDTSPPSSVIPRKRTSRAKPKPTPPPPPPPPSMPSPYPYTPHSQYPYPYYMPAPYSMSPYGPHPSSSLSSAAYPPPPSSIPPSSAYSPYAALPGAYPYPYSPYGYPPTHPPPPGYPYPPPRYMPSPYGSPPLQPGQLYIPQQPQPGAYPSQYGYPKDTNFLYYHHPLEVPTVEVSSSRKKRKRGEEVLLSKEPPPDSALSLPTTMEQSMSGENPPVAHLTNGIVGPGTQTSDKDTNTTETKQQAGVVSVVVQMRPCGNKTCNRTIPIDTAGAMCEKCRVRFKKRQAKAKRRFKLEPRKSILNVKEGKKEDDDIDATIPTIPEDET